MFCAFLGSSTLSSCLNGGAVVFLPASLGGTAGVELFMNNASIMSSSNLKEVLSTSKHNSLISSHSSTCSRTVGVCNKISTGRSLT